MQAVVIVLARSAAAAASAASARLRGTRRETPPASGESVPLRAVLRAIRWRSRRAADRARRAIRRPVQAADRRDTCIRHGRNCAAASRRGCGIVSRRHTVRPVSGMSPRQSAAAWCSRRGEIGCRTLPIDGRVMLIMWKSRSPRPHCTLRILLSTSAIFRAADDAPADCHGPDASAGGTAGWADRDAACDSPRH